MNLSDTAHIAQPAAIEEPALTRLDAAVSEARVHRAAVLKKISFSTLLISVFAYPFVAALLIALPHDFATDWAYSSLDGLRLYAGFMAVLATSMIGGAYEAEFRERALTNPDIGATRAIIESSLRLIAWTVFSPCSMIVVFLTASMTDTILGI